MKIKTILFYAWVIILIVTIYASFKTKVKIHLFSLLGYNIGLSDIYSNMPIKLAILTVMLISFYVYSKDTEIEDVIANYPLKYIKKKKQKLTQIKQTIKVK